MFATRSLSLLAVAAVITGPTAFAADANNGKALFEAKACSTCHSVTAEPGGPPTGPTLAGVVGRKAAAVKDFPMYSQALKASDITWNAKTLDEFLANPMGKVPGTMMLIPLPDANERADVIAYLSTLKK